MIKICLWQHCHGRFFLVENPAGSLAWAWENLLSRLLKECQAKFVVSDQCAYGKVDLESGKPIRKPTGWLSNDEVLLNHLGKRCTCPWGSHELVLGSNRFGRRSRQAAAYPVGLCKAICQGILDSMKVGYASRVVQELSFAGEEDIFSDQPMEIEENNEEMQLDTWQALPGKIVRFHQAPRLALFSPMSVDGMPCEFADILPRRVTFMKYEDGTEETFEDEWTSPEDPIKRQGKYWTGRTEVDVKEAVQGSAMPESAQPMSDDGPGIAGDDGLRTPADGLRTPTNGSKAPATPGGDATLRRRRARTRQLQRGFWQKTEAEDVAGLLERTRDHLVEKGGKDWQIIAIDDEVGALWKSLESANADVTLVFGALNAKKLRKPQPLSSPLEAPLRKALLMLQNGQCLTTSWEEWHQQAPSSQTRPLVAENREVCVLLYGKPIGEEDKEEPGDPRSLLREQEREQKWQSLPRELKLALRRIHVNLGHATIPQMLRAMRVSRASEVAIRACRLFRCKDCPRIQLPKHPRPSKLPLTEEFNIQIGVDVFQEKDANGHSWSWLNVLCQGTSFQICVLLEDTSFNPTAAAALRAFETGWTSWAGYPEHGVFTDRAKYFMSEFAEALAHEGCYFDAAARASPWQLGQVERHGDIWKQMVKKLVWAEQLAGKEMMIHATSAINQAKNTMVRKSGFSPSQWVLGRSIRLPADLTDDSEAVRLGALSLSTIPTSRFYLKSKLRFLAREAFVQTSNSEALQRAELRRVRPSRGPFPVGSYVFFFDAADREPGPSCWRGVARVVGHEGSHTVWLSHRGLIVAASPEHLAFAFDDEIQQWTVVGSEMELLDATPAAGGTGFIDLRSQPKPPEEGFPEDVGQEDQIEDEKQEDFAEGQDVAPKEVVPAEDLSSTSTSMGRMRLESQMEERRQLRSSRFFQQRQDEREAKKQRKMTEMREKHGGTGVAERGAGSADPAMMEFDPEVDDYHQSVPTGSLPSVFEDESTEAQERASKRLRVVEPGDREEGLFSYLAVEKKGFLDEVAVRSYFKQEEAFLAAGVSLSDFIFGVHRNDFEDRYQSMYEYAMGASSTEAVVKKKGRKEIRINELNEEQRRMFVEDGADEKEWKAWKEKEAVDVLSPQESNVIRQDHPDLIIPTRWVRTNKNDGIVGAPFLAKSRLVVQGFKDKSLGYYRRDAPTASALAESLCLAVVAYMGFALISKDVKNAYFSGKSVSRDIYLEQPRGGLPDLKPKQLLKAKKAIYGFSEAARMFWLALKEHLESDGWTESRLEPALFFLRREGKLRGILVTHVDDLEGGVHKDFQEEAFRRSGKALEFATNHFKEFIFRGREMKQTAEGHIDVSMRNYALSMKGIKIDPVRKKQLEASLTAQEMEIFQSSAGELGWLTRQLRCDLAYENGCIQRCKTDACIADLIKLKQFVGAARRGADFRLRYWADVDLQQAVLIHLADSGHANGTPEKDDIIRYRSVGGFFLLLANPEVLSGGDARANVIAFQSGVTKRVCRSTLAAEASHLAEAVEAGDWCAVLLEEALTGEIDLQNWPLVVQKRQRVYVTDARSVYDYLQKDATSTSTDKRMAIEGALLRETVRQPGAAVRWIDGMQNIADVLTKSNAEKDTLRDFMRNGMTSLVQTEKNKALKEKKRLERQRRAEKLDKPAKKAEANTLRRQAVAEDVRQEGLEEESEEEK